MSWLTLVNPSAGKGTLAAQVEEILEELSVPHRIEVSRSPAHLQELARQAAETGHERLLVVGGDGTVNLVVNAIAGTATDVVLGVLPAGTGCDLIRTFAIPQDLRGAARHLTTAETYRIDIGYVDGPWGRRHFANVASLGLGAAVVRVADRMPARWGSIRYKLAIWPALARFRATAFSATTQRRTIDGDATLIVLANAQFFGGGMNIAPKASLVDGALDVQVFTGPKRNALVLQHRVNRGTHLTHPAVIRTSSASVEIRLNRPWEVEVDGEYLGTADVLTAGVTPEALRLKI